MKKASYLSILAFIVITLVLSACGKDGTKTGTEDITANLSDEEIEKIANVVNGGFETGDLTGWEVIEGDAFSDDVVVTNETFWGDELTFNHEGNWHLYGLGFDESIPESKTGKLKSSTFTLLGDGKVSLKIGAARDTEKTYVAFYLAENDQLIAKQANTEFVDPGIADKSKYDAGLAFTNNYVQYELDLSEYLGKEMYIVIVDEDDDGDFGFINVDDIRTYYVDGVAKPQEPGEKFEKTRTVDCEDLTAPSKYEIINGDFEQGNLCGWTIDGDAFNHQGVTSESTWWAEKIPYNRDGEYHYGLYNEAGIGTLTSSTFELGGSGYITFKLGGAKNNEKTYISIYDAATNEEIARFGNSEFADVNFPNIDEGMRLANLVQYKADLSEHIGKELYIVITDEATEDWGLMTFDSFATYHESIPEEGIEAINLLK